MSFERLDFKACQLRRFIIGRTLKFRGNRLIARLRGNLKLVFPHGKRIDSYLKHGKENERRFVKWLAVGRFLSSCND